MLFMQILKMNDKMCFICHDDDEQNLLSMNECCGCLCKGSINVHSNCFQEFINVKRNLECDICKSSYSISKLSNFVSLEDLLLGFVIHNNEIDRYENLNYLCLAKVYFPVYLENFKFKFYYPQHLDFFCKIFKSLKISEKIIIKRDMNQIIISLKIKNFFFN